MLRTNSPLKAVLDTTVLISAFLKPGGLSDEIINFAELELFEFISSDEILEEARFSLLEKNHIRQRYIYTDERVLEFMATLEGICTKVINPPPISVIQRDPKDDKILACAIASEADYIVSRDNHLLDLKEYWLREKAIKILTPEEFIRILRERL